MSRVPKVKWFRTIWKNQGRCWFCGDEAETVDHAKPRSRKGTNKDDNLLPACFYCNNMKSDLCVREFRRVVRMLVVRRLFNRGIILPEGYKLPIVFFGEGNPAPFRY